MKKVGFIDYFLSEWHANNYPIWMKDANKVLGTDYEVAYAWAELDVSPYDGVTTDAWCKEMGVCRCESIAEVCEKSDVIIILSPDDPEHHLPYAREVLPYGKPTYIDKPFTDSVEAAQEIFQLAAKYNTPFFSTSALRYATELDAVEDCVAIATLGGGANAWRYIIHQAEMVVKKLGLGAKAVMARVLSKDQVIFSIRYDDDRAASMHFAVCAPFEVIMTKRGDVEFDQVYGLITEDEIFNNLIKDMLNFFETGKPSFDVAQTLEVNRIYVAAIEAEKNPEQWVEIG